MKISEITVADVASFIKLEEGEYNPNELKGFLEAAKQYVADHTGIPQASTDTAEGTETLDDHPDFYTAIMVLCQDMHDNRSYTTEVKYGANRVVDSILGLHARNLL